MTARMLAIGRWLADEDAPAVMCFCECGATYTGSDCPHCRPPIKRCWRCGNEYVGDQCDQCGNQHDNGVRGNDGKPLAPWHLEVIFQEMEAAGELNPYPGDLDEW